MSALIKPVLIKKVSTLLIRHIAAVALLGLWAGSGSASQSLSQQQLVQQVYDLSGLEQQFIHLGRAFTEEGLRMGRNELPDNEMSRQMLARLQQGLQEKYAPKKLRAAVQSILERELDTALIPQILDVMQSKVWRQAVRLEGRANDPANQQELEEYVAVRLQKQLPRQTRLDLIRALISKTDAVDMTTDLMISATLGAAGIMMGDSGNIPEQFTASIRQQMSARRAEYEEMVTRQFLYTYRFMSDQQLATYVAYYDQPAIKALSKATSQALTEALQ